MSFSEQDRASLEEISHNQPEIGGLIDRALDHIAAQAARIAELTEMYEKCRDSNGAVYGTDWSNWIVTHAALTALQAAAREVCDDYAPITAGGCDYCADTGHEQGECSFCALRAHLGAAPEPCADICRKNFPDAPEGGTE